MTGEQLKNVLFINKIDRSMITEQLGITPQAFTQMLKVADVKTGTLEKICRIIGKNMSFFYPECGVNNFELSQNNNNVNSQQSVIGGGSITQVESETVKGLLEQLKAKDEQIDKLINLLVKK